MHALGILIGGHMCSAISFVLLLIYFDSLMPIVLVLHLVFNWGWVPFPPHLQASWDHDNIRVNFGCWCNTSFFYFIPIVFYQLVLVRISISSCTGVCFCCSYYYCYYDLYYYNFGMLLKLFESFDCVDLT